MIRNNEIDITGWGGELAGGGGRLLQVEGLLGPHTSELSGCC